MPDDNNPIRLIIAPTTNCRYGIPPAYQRQLMASIQRSILIDMLFYMLSGPMLDERNQPMPFHVTVCKTPVLDRSNAR